MAQLAELLPVHAIDPSMHALVEGGPSERRRFLDWGVFHVEPSYLEAWKRYRRVLSQRNAALKRAASDAELRPWSMALVEAGAAVDEQPARAISTRLAPYVTDVRPAAAGSAADARLPARLGRRASVSRTRWPPPRRAIGRAAAREAGPHRAEIVLRLDDRRVQDEASRGQQKLDRGGA